ncbi:MAG: AsmA family protein [Bacteroidota bacterium]|nr:AsmA family protein [Bacteroidota bacterium]
MTKKVSKIFLYSILTIVLLLAILAGYTQTGLFRKNLRSTVYEIMKKNLNASVYIGEIHGNIVTGLSIDTLMIYVDNAPFVESGKIAVEFDLYTLLDKKISIDSVRIENPSVHLFRWKDGSWNTDHLAMATSPKDSTPSPWKIDVRKISLANAQFFLVDSTGNVASATMINGRKVMNYSDLSLKSINVDANGYYSSERLRVHIGNLSLLSPNEDFILNKLSADFVYTKDSTRLKALTIRTPHSDISCDASLAGLNLFAVKDLKEFQDTKTRLVLSSSTIASRDIQTFLPELYFLRGPVTLDGTFQGTFEQLTIKKLEAVFGKTALHLTGSISNIHDPKELRLNIVSKQSLVYSPDVAELLPYFGIPNYPQLGLLAMDFQFVGKPLDFMVISKMKSAAGTVTVDGEMLITEDNIHYKGLLAGTSVNLEKIFTASEFASRLNTKAYIEGSGTSIDKLDAHARVEIDSSTFRGISVSSASLELKAKEKIVDASLALMSPDGNIRATGTMDFQHPVPAYTVSTKVRGLNLAPILQDDYYSSRLSFDLTREADALNVFDGNSSTNVTMLPSMFREYAMDSSRARLDVMMDSTRHRSIMVQSPVVDGDFEGVFTVKGFLHILQASINQFNEVYTYQRRIVDSSFVISQNTGTPEGLKDTLFNTVQYTLHVKNLLPVSVFFRLPMFDAKGSAVGILKGDNHSASLQGTMELERLTIEQDSTLVQGRNVSVAYNTQDILQQVRKHSLPLKVELLSKADELSVNRTVLKNPVFDFTMNDSSGTYKAYTDVDTTISFGLEGSMAVHHDAEKLEVKKLMMRYQGYQLENQGPIAATLDQTGISVDSALLAHRDQTLSVKGHYGFHGAINVAASLANFEFSDLHYFQTSPDTRENMMALGGIIQADAKLSGTAADPQFVVTVKGNDLSYQKSLFGYLRGTVEYADRIAAMNVEILHGADTASVRDVELKGNVPIDLQFGSAQNRTTIKGLDVALTSTNLQLSALDPFIPELKEMTGVIRSKIHITGSLAEPLFQGSAELDNGGFVLEMNGLPYLAAGTVEFNQNKVSFPKFIITNTAADYSDGKMAIGGFILLKSFAPEEYHLHAKGELLVLSDRSKTASSSFFGTLVASTSSDSLLFDGTFDRSRITGVVFIQQGSLTFPPTQQALSSASSSFNIVDFVDDTTKAAVDTTVVQSLLQRIQQITLLHKSKKTFLDGFGYGLTIQTRGAIRVNMIFNANAGAYEELYAELNGKLILTKDENGVQLKGMINVGNESNYTFYKKFNASGAMTFVGDPQNPQLDILAAYEGTHLDKDNATKEDRVVVTLKISGTRAIPILKIGLKIIDQSGKETERTGDVENDAISFLLTSSPGTPGKFRDELTAQDRNRISDQLASTIGGTWINSLLSGYVMGFVQKNKIPLVKSFEVRQVGADPDIRIGAEFLDTYINVGGKVFSDVNNTNFSLQVPLGNRQKRNFMLEVEKKTESYDYSLQSRTTLGARIYYRFTF